MVNKKFIIGLVVIVTVVLGGFSFMKRAAAPGTPEAVTPTDVGAGGAAGTGVAPTPVASGTKSTAPAAPVMTKSGEYLVSYLNSGFSPKTLTIKRGKAVHFVNNSSKAMSLTAVDQNSQIYRELNQEQSVGRGGYYNFTFLTAGTWEYMNRDNKTDRGTIIVQ